MIKLTILPYLEENPVLCGRGENVALALADLIRVVRVTHCAEAVEDMTGDLLMVALSIHENRYNLPAVFPCPDMSSPETAFDVKAEQVFDTEPNDRIIEISEKTS